VQGSRLCALATRVRKGVVDICFGHVVSPFGSGACQRGCRAQVVGAFHPVFSLRRVSHARQWGNPADNPKTRGK